MSAKIKSEFSEHLAAPENLDFLLGFLSLFDLGPAQQEGLFWILQYFSLLIVSVCLLVIQLYFYRTCEKIKYCQLFLTFPNQHGLLERTKNPLHELKLNP